MHIKYNLETEGSHTPTRGAAKRVSIVAAAIAPGRVSGRVLGSARLAGLLAR